MNYVEFGEVAEIDRTVASEEECKTLAYVGLEHIKKETGRFAPEFAHAPEMLLASKFKFTPRHILYGKLRPYLNKVVRPTFDGVCSTDILPILPDETQLDRTYLWAIFLSPKFVAWASANVSGANLPRLDPKRLEEYVIPLPPLPEQHRIAALLAKADRLRRTRGYAAQLSDTFLQAVFVRMFGDYIAADTDTRFQDVLAMPLQNGFFETNDKYGSGTPVVWVDNLYHTISIDTTNLRRVQTDEEAIKKYEVVEGDLLFTRSSLVREGVGQVNIVPELEERTMFESHIIRARVNQKKVNPFFILELFRSNFGRTFIMRGAHTATMTTVQQDTIEELRCPLPPLAHQQKFARVVQQFERLRAQQREAERQAEHLFQTLLHRAFSRDV